jgi:hypothetical protein
MLFTTVAPPPPLPSRRSRLPLPLSQAFSPYSIDGNLLPPPFPFSPPLFLVFPPPPSPLPTQMTPGDIKFLTEQPMFFVTGIWTSSLIKLAHYTNVLLGRKAWKGRGKGVCAIGSLHHSMHVHCN